MNLTDSETALVGGKSGDYGLVGPPESWSPEISWSFGLERTVGDHWESRGCPKNRLQALQLRDDLNAVLGSALPPWRVVVNIGSGIPGGELRRLNEIESR